MDARQFLQDILRPTLIAMDMASGRAEKLLLMTACHESGGFRWERQLQGGPARSFYQIEPATLKDLYLNYLRFRPALRERLDAFLPYAGCEDPEAALMDRSYATAAARMIYWRDPQPLPDMDDDAAMAATWKRWWNTTKGKGTVEKFLDDWARYKPEGYV